MAKMDSHMGAASALGGEEERESWGPRHPLGVGGESSRPTARKRANRGWRDKGQCACAARGWCGARGWRRRAPFVRPPPPPQRNRASSSCASFGRGARKMRLLLPFFSPDCPSVDCLLRSCTHVLRTGIRTIDTTTRFADGTKQEGNGPIHLRRQGLYNTYL